MLTNAGNVGSESKSEKNFLTGQLRYNIAREKDYGRIRQFLDYYFCPKEPLQVALNTVPEEIHEQYDAVLPLVLSKPISILGFDKDDLVCICLNSIQEQVRDESIPPLNTFNILKDDYSQDIQNGPYRSEKANSIYVFLNELEKGLPNALESNSRLFNIEIIVVHPLYNGRGLCSELIDLSSRLAKLHECDSIASCATNGRSQHAFLKKDFKPIKEIPLDKFLRNSVPVFPNPDISSCILMIKPVE